MYYNNFDFLYNIEIIIGLERAVFTYTSIERATLSPLCSPMRRSW